MSVLRAAEASWEVVVANDAAHAKVPRVALEFGCIWWLVGWRTKQQNRHEEPMKNPNIQDVWWFGGKHMVNIIDSDWCLVFLMMYVCYKWGFFHPPKAFAFAGLPCLHSNMTGYMSYGPGLCSWRRDEDLICALLEKKGHQRSCGLQELFMIYQASGHQETHQVALRVSTCRSHSIWLPSLALQMKNDFYAMPEWNFFRYLESNLKSLHINLHMVFTVLHVEESVKTLSIPNKSCQMMGPKAQFSAWITGFTGISKEATKIRWCYGYRTQTWSWNLLNQVWDFLKADGHSMRNSKIDAEVEK